MGQREMVFRYDNPFSTSFKQLSNRQNNLFLFCYFFKGEGKNSWGEMGN